MNVDEFGEAVAERARHAHVSVPPGAITPLHQYFELLRRWNRSINLTALPLDPPTDEGLDRLLIEPLVVAGAIGGPIGRWFDLGSGGGSPAIPMRIVMSVGELVMIESKAKKVAFLREVVRSLQLSRTCVEHMRFEELRRDAQCVGSANLVTVRAVRVDPSLIELCRMLLAPSGRLALFGHFGDDLPGFRADRAIMGAATVFHVKQ